MSISLIPIITTVGLEAVLNATNDGLQAVIKWIALGDKGWTPTASATSLRNERNRVQISNGERIQPTQIHMTAVEEGSTEYWVREIGFILDDGTLLAIWSDPAQALAYKAADVDLLLAFDLLLSALPEDSITIDGTGGVNLAPATEEKRGIVRLATTDEAEDGSIDSAVVMTPADSRVHGDKRYARKSHEHDWSEITDKPDEYPPEDHDHDERYIRQSNFKITTGFVKTKNRLSLVGWHGYNDFNRNNADISPPRNYEMRDLIGFTASLGVVYYDNDVNEDDIIWVRWREEDNHIRVICNNSENRDESRINYMAVWIK